MQKKSTCLFSATGYYLFLYFLDKERLSSLFYAKTLQKYEKNM